MDYSQYIADKLLLESLKRLRKFVNGAYVPARPPPGICSWLRMCEQRRIRQLFPSWPEFSGCVEFPVPGGAEEWHYAHRNNTMWSGEYGAARLRLLKFIAESA